MDVLAKVKDKANRSAHQHAIYLSGYEPLWHEAAVEIERLRAELDTIAQVTIDPVAERRAREALK